MSKIKTRLRKPEKIKNEQLNKIQNLINNTNRAQIEIVSLETKKHALLHKETQLQGQMQTMQKTFEDTYGKVDINIQNGTINYPEDEQANKED